MSATKSSISAQLAEVRPSDPLPLPSRFGRYRLTRLLAIGGMAQIYLAKSFGAAGFVKSLVVKRLDPRLADKPYFTELFINEAKLLVTLSHGNIVSVFDFGRVGNDLYMAMEYVRGSSLGWLLKALETQGKPLGLQLAAYIAMEVCKGLDYAHRKTDGRGRPAGIIHRDIKPSNILISFEGEVKLVDFGVAKLAGRLEQKQQLAGTVAYMSPEQASQQPVDARTDIFSSALVLHEMLRGRRVYEAESPSDMLRLARDAVVPDLPAQIPRELRAIVECASARCPEDRYATAHAMEQELSTYLLLHRSVGETVEGRSPSSQLSELMRAQPLEDLTQNEPDGLEADSDRPSSSTASPAPAAVPNADNLLPAPITGDDEPDLALIHGAAETFHSEFLTRVLHFPSPQSRWTRLKGPLGLGLSALFLVSLVAGLLWSSTGRQRPHRPPRRGATDRHPATAPEQHAATIANRPDATARPDDPPGPAPAARGAAAQRPADSSHTRPPRGGRPRRRVVSSATSRFGYLNLNSIPWSQVTVDGKRLGRTTPVLALKLKPGLHTVQLHNPDKGLRKTVRVRIRPGHTSWKVIRLR